jgi:hypothetical protein
MPGFFDPSQRGFADMTLSDGGELRHLDRVESILAQTTIAYLERRYLALEKEIENTLHDSPVDDFAVADLKCRRLIIADEIQTNRRLVENVSASSAPTKRDSTLEGGRNH